MALFGYCSKRPRIGLKIEEYNYLYTYRVRLSQEIALFMHGRNIKFQDTEISLLIYDGPMQSG